MGKLPRRQGGMPFLRRRRSRPREGGSERLKRHRQLSVESLEDRRLLAVEAFPTPLFAEEPPGSLVYDGQVDGQIETAGEAGSLTIDVDGGQTVTVLVETAASLRASVELIDPDAAVVGSAAAGEAGGDAVIQSASAASAGTYTLTVGGLDDSTGDYSVRLIFNAALELEQHGGILNESAAAAQDLDAGFADLGFGTAERAAVLGTIEREYRRVENLGAGVNTADQELNPAWSADGLTIYFNSNRPGGEGGQDLYMATRADPVAPFGNVTSVGLGINTPGNETAPALSADGLTLYFSSDRPGSENFDLYMATRASTSEPFGSVAKLGFPVNSVHQEGAPSISTDGLSLYFTSSRPGMGGNDIYVANRSDMSEAFGDVFNLGSGINSSSDDSRPEISRDGLVLAFSSNRPGGSGENDIYVATRNRNDVLAEFEAAVISDAGVNTAASERGPALSSDGTTLLFDSDRAGGEGQNDIYQAIQDEDWYHFTLSDGDSATLALTRSGLKNSVLELYDHESKLLAVGAVAANADLVLNNFVDHTSDGLAESYFARVAGYPAEYSLVVTRNADFDTEPNDDAVHEAQDISAAGIVLGHVGDSTSADRLFGFDEQSNNIYEMDPVTGGVINSFPSPLPETEAPDFGMATTKKTLLVGSGTPIGSHGSFIIELDMNSGATIRHLSNLWNVSGMAVLDGEIYILDDVRRGVISVADYETGRLIGAFRTSPAVVMQNLGASFNMLLGTAGNGVYQIDPRTGATTLLGTLTELQSEESTGLAVVGDELFIADHSNGFSEIDVYDLETVSYKRSLQSSLDLQALGADGGGQIAADFYSVRAQAGDSLVIETNLPAEGPGEFVNRSNLALELYDPSGLLVASSSAGPLHDTATMGGKYTVGVSGENGTSGEYVLRWSGQTGGLAPFEVTSSELSAADPPDSGPAKLRIDLSHQVLVGSVDVSDLFLDGTAATGVSLVDGDTLEFTLPPLTDEAHTVTIPHAAMVDLQGQPIEATTLQLVLDSVPFPVPLESKGLPGSLVYDPQAEGQIDGPGDLDGLTIDLDAGQTVTVLVESDPSLQASVGLVNSTHMILGSVVAGQAGADAILQTIPVTQAGTYTVTVTGTGGTTGGYAVRVILNAALEFETHGGPPNDDAASSQDLDATFVSLGFGAAERGAVVGSNDFRTPTGLGPAVNTPDQERNPAISADGLTLYFNSDRAGGMGGHDLYMATRGHFAEAFGNVTNLGGLLNTSSNETAPAISLDGLTLYFTSDRPGSQNTDIYMATRESLTADFADVVRLGSPVNTSLHDGSPAISSDGLSLYFTSNRPGMGGNDLFVATRLDPTGPFTGLSNRVEKVNSESADTRPEISNDGLTLYFGSNRPGGMGSGDLYSAQRESLTSKFGSVATLGSHVNSEAADQGPAVSADGNLLVFDSDRSGGLGQGDLYFSTREDWYRFSLGDGESASLAVEGPAGASADIELYDGSMRLVATAISTDTARRVISAYVDTTADGVDETYFIRVQGTSPEYVLVVTRGAEFDTELGNDLGQPGQDVTLTGTVLGHVGATRAGGRLFVYDAGVEEILELDPQTGRRLRRFPSPIEAAAGPDFGLASTPTTILAGGSASEDIVELDPDTGAVLRRLTNPGVDVSGLAFYVNEIYVLTDTPTGQITVLDYATGATKRTIHTSRISEAIAMSDSGSSDEVLWGTDGIDRYRISRGSSSTSFFATLRGGPDFIDAAGSIGEEMFVGENSQVYVYRFENGCFCVHRTLPGLENIEAIGADGAGVGGVDVDVYRVEVNEGDTLTVQTRVPAGGPFEFVNALDIAVELHAPDGSLAAASNRGSLVHTATQTGSYSVRVIAGNDTEGEYVLNVSGYTGALPALQVTASNLADGDIVPAGQTTLRVELSEQLLAADVESSDLQVDGGSATAVTAIDSRTLEFTFPPLAAGVHQLQIPAGAFVGLKNQPIEEFSIEVTVDTVAPRVVSTSIQDGLKVRADVPITVTLRLDETLGDLPSLPSGLLGEYYLPGGTLDDFPDFDVLVPVHRRVDPVIHFPERLKGFGGLPGLDTHFAVRWTGQLLVEESDLVELSLTSDDGSRLFIDGQLFVDNGGTHPAETESARVMLDAGLHDIRIEYFNAGSPSQIILTTFKDGRNTTIPDSVFFHPPVSLLGLDEETSTSPDSFHYDPANSTLTLVYPPLDEDDYRLTLFGGPQAVEDLAGNVLDGEPTGFPLPPNRSGDGVPGGNFFIHFSAEELDAGDMNGDGQVDVDDTALFVMALVDRATYEATYGFVAHVIGDMDGDGDMDIDDVDLYVVALTGGGGGGGGGGRNLGRDAVAVSGAASTAGGVTHDHPGHDLSDHVHHHVSIFLDGQAIEIPANLGVDPVDGIIAEVHTHQDDNVVHVHPIGPSFDPLDDYPAISELFRVWSDPEFAGQAGANPDAVFSEETDPDTGHTIRRLMDRTVDLDDPNETHTIRFLVNGVDDPQFDKYLMRDGDQIVISYEEKMQAGVPRLNPMANLTMASGQTFHVPLAARDPEFGPIAYDATVSDPRVTAEIISGGKSVVLTVSGTDAAGVEFTGNITIRLFDGLTPDTAARFIELIEEGFYDGILFHRIIKGFVAQFGSPNGDGRGGSGVLIPDEYDPTLTFNGYAQLGLAKRTDNTGDSQAFITDTNLSLNMGSSPSQLPPQHLNFNHTIFGQVVDGFRTLNRIFGTPVTGSAPDSPVVIDAARYLQDSNTGVLRLTAEPGFTGEVSVAVTATDTEGKTAVRSFGMDVIEPTHNSNPYLDRLETIQIAKNTPTSVPLMPVDIDGNPIELNAFLDGSAGALTAVNFTPQITTPDGITAAATMTIVPREGFVGTTQFWLGVHRDEFPEGDPVDFEPNPFNVTHHSFADFQLVEVVVRDIDVGAFPTPLQPLAPLGSLVYRTSADAEVIEPGELTGFTIDLDDAQTMTVVVEPDTGLQPAVEVLGPTGASLGAAAATAAGEKAVLLTVAVAGPGSYTIQVSGEANTTGSYTATLILNAAVELEEYGGQSNEFSGFAQDLDPSLAPLGSGPGERVAVLGNLSAEPGAATDWYRFTLDDGDSAALALTSQDPATLGLVLYDDAPTPLAMGTPAGNSDQVINGFVDATNDGEPNTYFVRVVGDGADYSLVVMRNADFDTEPLDTVTTAFQDITLTGTVVGGLPSSTSPSRETASGTTSLPLELVDGTGFRWDIHSAGVISPGLDNAYDQGLIRFDFSSFSTGQSDLGGREVVLGPDLEGDVELWRKVYIPEDQGFARFLEIVTNRSDSSANYSFVVSSDFGSDTSTRIISTASGDDVFDVEDDWIVTDDFSDGDIDPTLLHVVAGPGGIRPSFAAFVPIDDLAVEYDLNLAPGETQIVMHFAAKNVDRATALEKGPLLTDLGLGALAGMTDAERAQTVNFDIGISDDYAVEVQEGDVLSISTSLPAAGPFEFDNRLDIGVELYDLGGSLVESHGGGTFQHTALEDGTYHVRVHGNDGTAGEYVLNVSGHTGGLPPFEVSGTDPADGSRFRISPDKLQIDFSDHVLLPTAAASDVLIHGTPALDLDVLDGDTLQFHLPELVEGANTISIAAGALLDVQGQPVPAFEMELIIDTTAPRFVNSSIQQDDTVPTGTLVYVAEFDEPLLQADLDASDVMLVGQQTGPHVPTSFHYDPATSAVTVEYAGLVEDQFTLRLLSGSGAFEDLLGHALDGEPLAFPVPPNRSGDGSPGGDFVVEFSTDFVAHPFPVPLEAKQPLGSLVYDPQIDGRIDTSSDVDRFTIDVDDGQTITVLVEGQPPLQPNIVLLDPGGLEIGAAAAGSSGGAAILQTVPTNGAGTYTVEVTGVTGSTGRYAVQLYLNAALEFEPHTGLANDGLASSEDLDGSFISLGFGSAERGAVVGSGAFGSAANLGAGVNTASGELNPTVSADGLTVLFNSDRAGGLGGQDLYMATRSDLSEPFGNVTNLGPAINTSGTETAPALSADGLSLYFASIRPGSENLDLYVATRASASELFGNVVQLDFPVNTVHHDSAPAISSDGLSLYFTSNRPGFGGNDIYVATRSHVADPFITVESLGEEINTAGAETRPELSHDGLSLYFTSNRAGGFGLEDLYVTRRVSVQAEFGPPVNLGPQVNTAAAERGPTLSLDENLLLFDSDRTGGHGAGDLYSATREDWYRFTLADGATASLAVRGSAASNMQIELYDDGGALLALGSGGVGPEAVISSFLDTTTDAAADTYHVRVSGITETYTLVVTRDAAWDTDPNPTPGLRAQDITPTGTVVGHVGATREGGRLFVYDAALDEIQELDPQTGRKIHRFPSPISAAPGPDFGMASTPTSILAGGSAADDIVELDPDTGVILRRIPNPGVAVSGMAFLERFEKEIYLLTDTPRSLITVLDYETGAVVRQSETWPLSEALAATPVRILGIDAVTLYGVDPFNFRRGQLGTCGGGITFTDAMGFINDELFVGDGSKINVYEFGFGSLTLLRTLPGLVNVEAIGADGDGADGVDADVYRVAVSAGDTLRIQTHIPAAGPLEFANTLDIGIELYDTHGELVVGSADGSLVHDAVEAGTYSVRVFAENGTQGEYVLNVSGHSGRSLPFEVTASDPADGDAFPNSIPTLRVELSDQVLVTSVQAADLQINGNPATGVAAMDSNAIRFTLPPLHDGVNQLSIAAGAMVSLTNEPLEAFTIEVFVDHVAPRVIGTSIQAGDTVTAGVPLTVTLDFDEPLRDLSEMSGGLLGEYYIPGGSVLDFPDYDALTPVHRRIDPIIYFPRVEDNFGGFPDLDEHFAARWRGQILIEEAGSVDFDVTNSLTSDEDDHVRLFIDDILVADTTTASFPGEGSINLSSGLHDIRLEYFNATNHSQVLFNYRPVNGEWQLVPDSVLLRPVVSLSTHPTGNPSASIGSYSPDSFNYDPVDSTLTIEYPPLPEGLYQLTVHSELGEVEDRAGNALDGEATAFPLPPNVSGDGIPGGNFIVNFAADVNTRSFPVPLEAKQPLGSLIYDPVAEGRINSVVDVDGFSIDLDGGQTLTVVVTSDPSLRPEVEVRDANDDVIRTATAGAAGHSAIVQTAPITDPGAYSIMVRGVDGTLGDYAVRAILNAAVEDETYGGAANDAAAMAQDLDSSFLSLGFDSAERGAVLGSLPPLLSPVIVASDDFESEALGDAWTTASSESDGRVFVTGERGTAAGSFALIMDRTDRGQANLNEAVWTVDLSGLTQATLTFFQAGFHDDPDPLPDSFEGSFNGDGVSISEDGVRWHTVYQASAPSQFFFTPVVIDLDAEAIAAGMTLDEDFQIKFQQYDDLDIRGYDDITITTSAPVEEDWYSLTLADGDFTTLILTSANADSSILELYDSEMNLLATGASVASADSAIHHWVDATGNGTRDRYFARVAGGTDYSLFATRNADFDLGASRDPLVPIQDITSAGTVFGFLGDRVIEDFEDGDLDEYRDVGGTTSFSVAQPAVHDGQFGLRSSRGTLGSIIRTDGRTVVREGDSFSAWVNMGERDTSAYFLFGASESSTLGLELTPFGALHLFERNGSDTVQLASVSQFYLPFRWYRLEFDWEMGGQITAHLYDSDGTTLVNSVTAASSGTIRSGSIGFQAFRFDAYFDTIELLDGDGIGETTYAVQVEEGDLLAIRTALPASGPGQFVNTLDPRLVVLDPSGSPIASDSNSLDGRNARVDVRAAVSGVYTIQIAAEVGRGEYVLDANVLAPGDMNGDGRVDNDDTRPFVLALIDRRVYEAAFGLVAHVMGDMDGDGDLDVDDVGPFQDALTSGGQGAAAPASLAADPVTAPASASPMTVGGVSNPSQVGWVFNPSQVGWVFNPSQVGWVFNPSQVGWVSNASLFATRTTAASLRRDGLESHPTNDLANSDTIAQVARGIVVTDREARRRVGFARSHIVSAEADRVTEPSGRSHGVPDRLLDRVWQEEGDWRHDDELG